MFVINWQWKPGAKAYRTKGSPNHKPYASDPRDPDVQQWATRKNAERFLSRKDPTYASQCLVEEI